VRNVAEDFHSQVRPRVEQLLAPGESLEGVCAGLLGRLAGGNPQQAGLAALATWVRRHHPEG
jgi:hypothetical protein